MTKTEAASAVDLTDFIALDSTDYNVQRNGVETGWIWTLADAAHPQALKLRDEAERKAIKKAALQEQQRMNGRKVKVDEPSPGDARRELIEGVAGRVLDFSPANIPLPEFPGTTTYSPAMAIKVLSHPKLAWLLNDLINRVTDDQTFMKASASD